MNPSEYLDVLARLLRPLRAGHGQHLSGRMKTALRAFVGAWFSQYRPAFLAMLGDEGAVKIHDEHMQTLLKLTAKDRSRRTTVLRVVGAVRRDFVHTLFVPLSRAYWSRVPEQTAGALDPDVAIRLRVLDAEVADSYEQAIQDLEDDARLSYRGPASELREVLTGVLHSLAPTKDVQATEWYREARRSGGRTETVPTRAERVRFILRSRETGGGATEAAESFMSSVEERLASVVNATYQRGAAATHAGTERAEVIQLLQYTNALLKEVLPS